MRIYGIHTVLNFKYHKTNNKKNQTIPDNKCKRDEGLYHRFLSLKQIA